MNPERGEFCDFYEDQRSFFYREILAWYLLRWVALKTTTTSHDCLSDEILRQDWLIQCLVRIWDGRSIEKRLGIHDS